MSNFISKFGELIILIFITIFCAVLIFSPIYTNASGEENQDMLSAVGSNLDYSGINFSTFTDVSGAADMIKQEPPKILYDNVSIIKKNETVNLLSFFYIESSFENVNALQAEHCKIEVTDIIKSDGTSIIDLYSQSDKLIQFPEAGEYTVSFYLIDEEQRTASYNINIPVEWGEN